ncbi:unnamed protein product [Closterium sp. NIES-53]
MPLFQFDEPLLQDRVPLAHHHSHVNGAASGCCRERRGGAAAGAGGSGAPGGAGTNISLSVLPYSLPPIPPSFSDLTEKVRWAQENDEEVQRLVQAANQFATYACTWTGRTLYWGLMLVKYYDTLQNPDAITEPPVKQICDKSPFPSLPSLPPPSPMLQSPNTTVDPASVKCADPDAAKKNPECIFFCSSGTINHFIWHKAEALADLKKVGPP